MPQEISMSLDSLNTAEWHTVIQKQSRNPFPEKNDISQEGL